MKRVFNSFGGWIVFVVAIVAMISLVMLLMKPNGVMANAFENITTMFTDKSQSLINDQGDGGAGGPASCGIEGHYVGDGLHEHGIAAAYCLRGHTYSCECEGWVVPEGGTYTLRTAVNGKSTYVAGEQLPCGYSVANGDIYTAGDYKYTLQLGNQFVPGSVSGWAVTLNLDVTDKTKSSYGPILESINGYPVTLLNNTFSGCTNLTTSPELPSGTIEMYATFQGCTSLNPAPAIPSSVTNMEFTFFQCTSLTAAPAIPDEVYTLYSTFSFCASLADVSALVIPSSVWVMTGTFSDCTALTGTLIVNVNARDFSQYVGCFANVDFAAQNLTLAGDSNWLTALGNTGINYTAQ